MALLIIAPTIKTDAWEKHLRKCGPDIDLRVWPDTGNADDIEFVLAWEHPHGVLARFRNLKCIASLGAGVDHLLQDAGLPRGVPVTRIVDPSMARSMSRYVIMAVLNHCRHFDTFLRNQSLRTWQKLIPRRASKTRIGIMGLGRLGRDAAVKLRALGFPVAGWRRTPEAVEGIDTYTGMDQLEAFLSRSDILICMLPLTPETRGILNAE